MENPKIYRSAYRREVVPNEWTAKHPLLMSIQGTDFIVRRYKAGDSFRFEPRIIEDRKKDLERWRKFKSFPGIYLPSYSGVAAHDDFENPVFDIVTERIEGVTLDELPASACDKKVITDLSELMIGIVEYSKDVFSTRSSYLSDQNLSQYVYGSSHTGVVKPYFVDLGMESRDLPETTGQSDANSYFFANYLPAVFSMIEELEKKTRTPFVESRVKLGRFLELLPQGTGGRGYARSLMQQVLGMRLPE